VVAIVVVGFVLGGWDVSEFAVQSSVVEPFDVGKRLKLEVLGVAPGTAPADEFGLVETVHRLGERVVVAVADGPDRGERTDLGESFGVENRGVLAAGVGMCDDETSLMSRVRRLNTAISNASITMSVVIDDDTRQPTTNREYTSMMNATYTNPDQVGT